MRHEVGMDPRSNHIRFVHFRHAQELPLEHWQASSNIVKRYQSNSSRGNWVQRFVWGRLDWLRDKAI
ncbi:hypothetical protein MTIM_16520 [Mycobacterium timonense]|uniref:Uncharacterized protein n=1 Tax=Mycobacterium timonense TaxID=701043 RepID=A0A7I9Z4F6_9MYCO|nr:hypothetical protein MTIM_16520 [Mycobacterium timonense]